MSDSSSIKGFIARLRSLERQGFAVNTAVGREVLGYAVAKDGLFQVNESSWGRSTRVLEGKFIFVDIEAATVTIKQDVDGPVKEVLTDRSVSVTLDWIKAEDSLWKRLTAAKPGSKKTELKIKDTPEVEVEVVDPPEGNNQVVREDPSNIMKKEMPPIQRNDIRKIINDAPASTLVNNVRVVPGEEYQPEKKSAPISDNVREKKKKDAGAIKNGRQLGKMNTVKNMETVEKMKSINDVIRDRIKDIATAVDELYTKTGEPCNLSEFQKIVTRITEESIAQANDLLRYHGDNNSSPYLQALISPVRSEGNPRIDFGAPTKAANDFLCKEARRHCQDVVDGTSSIMPKDVAQFLLNDILYTSDVAATKAKNKRLKKKADEFENFLNESSKLFQKDCANINNAAKVEEARRLVQVHDALNELGAFDADFDEDSDPEEVFGEEKWGNFKKNILNIAFSRVKKEEEEEEEVDGFKIPQHIKDLAMQHIKQGPVLPDGIQREKERAAWAAEFYGNWAPEEYEDVNFKEVFKTLDIPGLPSISTGDTLTLKGFTETLKDFTETLKGGSGIGIVIGSNNPEHDDSVGSVVQLIEGLGGPEGVVLRRLGDRKSAKMDEGESSGVSAQQLKDIRETIVKSCENKGAEPAFEVMMESARKAFGIIGKTISDEDIKKGLVEKIRPHIPGAENVPDDKLILIWNKVCKQKNDLLSKVLPIVAKNISVVDDHQCTLRSLASIEEAKEAIKIVSKSMDIIDTDLLETLPIELYQLLYDFKWGFIQTPEAFLLETLITRSTILAGADLADIEERSTYRGLFREAASCGDLGEILKKAAAAKDNNRNDPVRSFNRELANQRSLTLETSKVVRDIKAVQEKFSGTMLEYLGVETIGTTGYHLILDNDISMSPSGVVVPVTKKDLKEIRDLLVAFSIKFQDVKGKMERLMSTERRETNIREIERSGGLEWIRLDPKNLTNSQRDFRAYRRHQFNTLALCTTMTVKVSKILLNAAETAKRNNLYVTQDPETGKYRLNREKL